MEKLNKKCIVRVSIPSMSYNTQEEFIRQGYFDVKVTPIGSNLVMMESVEDKDVQALVERAKG